MPSKTKITEARRHRKIDKNLIGRHKSAAKKMKANPKLKITK